MSVVPLFVSGVEHQQLQPSTLDSFGERLGTLVISIFKKDNQSFFHKII